MLKAPRVILTVGPPRSGKSTWARNFASENPNTALLSLDDFRRTFCGSKQQYWEYMKLLAFDGPMRWAIHDVQVHCLDYFLSRGVNVVVHNTHVLPSTLEREWHVCRRHAISPEFVVFERPLELLLQRNADSPVDDRVPEETIRRMHEEMSSADAWWRTWKHELA